MVSTDFSIACYNNEVPSFVASEMERLYGNIFSSYSAVQIPEDVRTRLSTYVVRSGDLPVTIFLFLKEDDKVRVLNEVISIGSEDISRFARHVFQAFRDVNIITFKAIETDIKRLPFPHQRFNYSEDIAMTLPATATEYLSSLGKNTRRNIKRYTDRLVKTFPSFEFRVYGAGEPSEAQIRGIIGLNRERMALKGKMSIIDEHETQAIIKRVQACGLVGIATIDGRIVAGTISYRAGDNFFLDVLSHDPAYNEYWVGILCCYRTICECIARGGREFHFLWGRYDYKFTLGATLRHLDHVAVYRSRLQYLLHLNLALKTAASGYLRGAKLWAYDRDGFVAGLLRPLKQACMALTPGRKSST